MNEPKQTAMLDPQRLMKALDDAAKKLQAMQRSRSEAIAVIGVDCRFPGAEDGPGSFWRMLCAGRCAISDVPADRWDADAYYDANPESPGTCYTKKGGFLGRVDLFDAKRFKISPREAQSMDPQQRLLLEVSWRAIERAGMAPAQLRGSKTGVFVGATYNEYAELVMRSQTGMNAYFGSGNALNAASGRLSFTYGLHGPSMTIDTACSSSLAALHAACASLRLQESDLALAGGVNLMLTPNPSIALCRARMLSPDGLCKTFDASANGYVRGEGCALAVLKRESDARRDGDPILGLIHGSAVNQDGPSSGFTVPNGRAQEALIQQALNQANISAAQIGYIEAHGTGTSLGDPIEIQSLANALGKSRAPGRPILVGSVKTNIGHLEAAAGMAGLIKALLIVQNGRIPPHLHFNTPNPHINWADIPVQVAAQAQDFPPDGEARYVGVSSFGASGTNCHLVLGPIDDDYAPSRTALPVTTFQPKRFWVEEKPASLPGELGDAALLLRRMQSLNQFSNAEQKLLPAFIGALQQLLRAPAQSGDDDLFYELSWLPRAPAPNAGGPLNLACGAELQQQLAPMLEGALRGDAINNYLQGVEQLEALSSLYACNALLELGLRCSVGGRIELDACMAELKIRSQQRRLLQRLLTVLEEDAWLAGGAGAWTVIKEIASTKTQPLVEQLLASYPQAQAEIIVFDRCAKNLAGVMRGETDPLPLLFPHDGEVSAARLYQDSPGAAVMNRLMQQAVCCALEGLAPGRAVRILEIGAGTGGTTSYILPHLPVGQVQYTYTDISPAFFQQAREKFGADSFIDYKTLDIEGDIQSQGFDSGAYDVVIAANVVHATRNLDETVGRIKTLLAPGGLLALYEGVGPIRFLDCIFGLTEGWWRFEDAPLRDAHPLISTQQWRNLFEARGFDQCCDFTPAAGLLSRQSVLCARNGGPSQPGAHDAWLLVHDENALSGELRQLLTAQNHDVVALPAPLSPEQASAALKPPRPLRGVVFLLETDECIGDDWTAAQVLEKNQRACESVLVMLRSLAAAQLPAAPSLFFVTSNAIAVNEDERPARLHYATLWGLRRVIAQEHPEWKPRCIDVGRGASLQAAQAVLSELMSNDVSDEVACRGAVRYELRFGRMAPRPEQTVAVHSGASYIITGGLGGIGLLLAGWLVERGAKRIGLLGRNAPGPSAQEKITQWNQNGADVMWLQCDVAVETQVAGAFNKIQQDGHALQGVLHAAGALDDGMLLSQTWSRFETVMRSKVSGAWNLHRQTRALSLDFFVLFSTTTAILGSPGQSNHAAANVFLDELAAYRRAQGLPAMSINWGPWSEIGAVVDQQVEDRLKVKGVMAMAPPVGMRCFERAMKLNARQIGVASIHWAQMPEAVVQRPLLESLRPSRQQPAGASAAPTSDFHSLPAAKRAPYLQQTISRLIHDILGMDEADAVDPGQGFFDMGLDSLSAVELRNQLHRAFGFNLPPTIAFNHPSVDKLTAYIISKEQTPAPPTTPVVQAQERLAPKTNDLDQLSEDELGALLDQELNQIEERHLQ